MPTVKEQTIIVRRYQSGIGFEIEITTEGAADEQIVQACKQLWDELKEAFEGETGYGKSG